MPIRVAKRAMVAAARDFGSVLHRMWVSEAASRYTTLAAAMEG